MKSRGEKETIKPEDVSGKDAKKILSFLNSVESAEELADAIEIPGERDVGIKVAKRILDERDKLGKYTNLKEIDRIKLVGPERFKDIVETLKNKKPRIRYKKGKMQDVVLYTNGPLTEKQIKDLKDRGLHIVSSLGKNAYRIRGVSEYSNADIKILNYVDHVSEFKPENKIDRSLKQKIKKTNDTSRRMGPVRTIEPTSEETVNVLISIDPNMDFTKTISGLKKFGIVKKSSKRRAMMKINIAKINEITRQPYVLAIETEPKNIITNNVARDITGITNITNNFGLDGSNEVIGVADSGLDTGVNNNNLLADFAGRVINIRDTVNKAGFGVADGADLNNHGTHVCGSILGNGANSNGNITGMAPAARLTMLAMGPDNGRSLMVPADLKTGVFQDAYNDNARLHNNSWGTDATGAPYSLYSEDVDEFIRDNPDMLIIIAAGNAGPGVSSLLPPGTAKNCLTVGACESVRPLPGLITLNPNMQDHDFNPVTPDVNVGLSLPGLDLQADNVEEIALFSGRGPTSDNRIKPDIVAPGTWILSCRSTVSIADVGPDGIPHDWLESPPGSGNFPYADDADGVATHQEAVGRGLPGAPFYGTWDQNTPNPPTGSGLNCQDNYFYNSGTSMASPIITGATALLRQYLRERRGIENPSAVLLKALLINGATVPTGQSNVPDNNRGFGWLNMENTISPTPTGQQGYSYDVDLAIGPPAVDGTPEVRTFSVLLADTNHPFRTTLVWMDHAASGIQNKLYLRVIAPDSTIYDGDVTAYPVVSNNVQRVHIENPIAGQYTIEVHGVDVIHGIDAFPTQTRQDFALAVINGIGFSPNPVDICQVVDKSGSMGYYGYIDPVRERTKQFVDMLRINDRTGAVSFNGTSSLVHSIVPIDGLPTLDAIKDEIDDITAGGVTSIGAGLELAQLQLDGISGDSHPQALVLLSDGHENTPPWVGGGVTDSPPAWYNGPDLTEILPTIPPETKIYTVSLGDQSDQVLLQDIANSKGGLFFAIHSTADIGKLHEIYVHLQALTGGEEVIASGSDNVDGISFQTSDSSGADFEASSTESGFETTDKGFASDTVDIDFNTKFRGLLTASTLHPKLFKLGTLRQIHSIPVDDTLSTLTMMVSWHDPTKPVSLTLISPSHKTILPSNVNHISRKGNTYQFIRIEKPEPGDWQLIVKASSLGGISNSGSYSYTWGAYGKSDLKIEYKLPKKLIGIRKLRLNANVFQQKKMVRRVKLTGIVNIPLMSTKDLIKKHNKTLKNIKLPFKPDQLKVDQNLYKLSVLDAHMVDSGKNSIFNTKPHSLTLTKKNRYADVVKTNVTGLYSVNLTATGKTSKGYTYQRQALFDIRI